MRDTILVGEIHKLCGQIGELLAKEKFHTTPSIKLHETMTFGWEWGSTWKLERVELMYPLPNPTAGGLLVQLVVNLPQTDLKHFSATNIRFYRTRDHSKYRFPFFAFQFRSFSHQVCKDLIASMVFFEYYSSPVKCKSMLLRGETVLDTPGPGNGSETVLNYLETLIFLGER